MTIYYLICYASFLDVTLFKDTVNMPSNYIWIRLNEMNGTSLWCSTAETSYTKIYICIKTERLKPEIR